MAHKCPKCNSNSLSFHAFSIDEDCYAKCENCNFYLETTVPWDNCNSVKEHDEKCLKALIKLLEEQTCG